MKTRFTRFAASAEIATGIVVILLGVALAAVVLFLPTESIGVRRSLPPREEVLARIAAAVGLIAAGLALGGPLIIFGQLVLVFLDMRQRLSRIDRRLRRWESSAQRGQQSRLTERLRPR